MRVMIQLRHSPQLHAAAVEGAAFATAAPIVGAMPGLELDHQFASVQIPRLIPRQPGASPFALGQPMGFSLTPAERSRVL